MTERRNKMLKERFKKDINDISRQQRQVKKDLKQAHRAGDFEEAKRLEHDKEYWRQIANRVLGRDASFFFGASILGLSDRK
jgi:hypothetical protein